MPLPTPHVAHTPPANFALPDLTPSIMQGFLWVLVKFWYVIPILFALAYIRGKIDRAEEKARTKRRARDWHEAQKEIAEEERRRPTRRR